MLHEQLPRSEQYRVDRGHASAEGPNMALIRKSMGIYDRPEQRRRGWSLSKAYARLSKIPT